MAAAPARPPQAHALTTALVILNPLAGRGRNVARVERHAAMARDVLAAHDFEVAVRITTHAGDARDYAVQAVRAGTGLVVAWGGDGTVNEAASALVRTGVPLAIVPSGSGNGLAAELGIPFEPRAALRVAASGLTRAIDAGCVDGHYFFNIAGIGLDAAIASRFAARQRSRRGAIGYLQLALVELARYRSATYVLVLDGDEIQRTAMLIALANGRQYGNRALIAPAARLDDGLLEVVIVDELSVPGILRRLPALFRGTLVPGPGVTMRPARQVEIRASGAVVFHVDGEPRRGNARLVAEIHEAALAVRAPRS